MQTRREFIEKTVQGAAVLAAASVTSPLMADEKKIRIGIIGAENSHTIGFGRIFNEKKQFPGCEVKYVWGETDAFAKRAAEKGSIPNIVKDPAEMMGKIDALIVDHRHAKYHLEAALPFVKEGIPTFVDKPFCYRVDEGKEFLRIAREKGTPVTSFSSIAQSEETFDIIRQLKDIKDIKHVYRHGPAEVDSKYGGIFFYGVHVIQPLMYMFGDDIDRVRMTLHGDDAFADVVFKSGLFASLAFIRGGHGWSTTVVTPEKGIKLASDVPKGDPAKNYVDMVEMFRTGKEPRSHESILACVAVLEALERSVTSQDWEQVVV